MTIRLVLADDHPIVLNGLQLLFLTEPDFVVLECCKDGAQTLQAVLSLQPDILVLDLKMPKMDGLMVLRELRQENSSVKSVILTADLDEEKAFEIIRLGVRGVVLKEMAPRLLVQCLRKVYRGEQWFERQSLGRALDRLLQHETEMLQVTRILTSREIELVRLVAKGFDNQQISRALFISEGTVKVHLHRIYTKLELKNRVALALYAQSRGLA